MVYNSCGLKKKARLGGEPRRTNIETENSSMLTALS